ncbi:thiolase [Paraburkholderia sp. RP-4-7]|uniref:Thiolase n=1 Tax=Paraburkholderia polaris TaxID=2728848 RepID=A0A848IQ60_9BURK|nr:OB-fold domain-containing protein [Paraburkholderia polaris]NMM03901.1 thiolase [Paraburkholderia polaris]
MTYLPSGMPAPEPGPEDAPFWQACQDKTLKIRFCHDCTRYFHPPMPGCPRCGSMDLGWKEVSGNGTVFTYTIGHHAVHPALKGHGPYNVSVILLDDVDDVRLVSNVIDVPPEELSIGMPVTVCFEPAGNGMLLPRFRRRNPSSESTGSAR